MLRTKTVQEVEPVFRIASAADAWIVERQVWASSRTRAGLIGQPYATDIGHQQLPVSDMLYAIWDNRLVAFAKFGG